MCSAVSFEHDYFVQRNLDEGGASDKPFMLWVAGQRGCLYNTVCKKIEYFIKDAP